MLPERRRQYLEAIGIDLWVRRARQTDAAMVLPEAARPAETPATGAPSAERAPIIPAPAVPSEELAAQWQRLLDEVRGCRLCPLHATRTQGVLGVGPKRADWLVIGEAPGAEEEHS